MTRRERWGLSGFGWALVAAVLIAAGSAVFFVIYPFLAITCRVDANVLVVEGWVHPYAGRAAVAEFKAGAYPLVFTTGGPVTGSGGYINDQNTSASVGADLLRKVGLPSEFIQMVPSRVNDRDRTYSSAVALRDWFHQHNREVHSLNIITENVHARRTRLLFAEAFGPKVAIGVIAVPDPDYDPRRWWRYSEGVREVVGETIAYIYAKCFFYPK